MKEKSPNDQGPSSKRYARCRIHCNVIRYLFTNTLSFTITVCEHTFFHYLKDIARKLQPSPFVNYLCKSIIFPNSRPDYPTFHQFRFSICQCFAVMSFQSLEVLSERPCIFPLFRFMKILNDLHYSCVLSVPTTIIGNF